MSYLTMHMIKNIQDLSIFEHICLPNNKTQEIYNHMYIYIYSIYSKPLAILARHLFHCCDAFAQSSDGCLHLLTWWYKSTKSVMQTALSLLLTTLEHLCVWTLSQGTLRFGLDNQFKDLSSGACDTNGNENVGFHIIWINEGTQT